jgi:peptidyl-prolyl cis-trans isomerase D
MGQLISSPHLAEVQGRPITPAMLTREMDLTLRARRNHGEHVTQQQAIEAGMPAQLLESLIGRTAVYAYAEKIGISASDTQVADYIRRIPSVLNPVTGAFDESAYASFLSQMHYSRPEFENDVRGDISTQLVLSALVSGVRAPASFGALAVAFQTETRTITVAEAPAAAVGEVPPPTEAQLQAFWRESQEQLRMPEFRALTLVYARAADFAPRVNIPEQRLRDEFEARRATLTQPERRSYVRIAAGTQAQANDAANRLTAGQNPEAIATALHLQVTRGTDQARTEVTDPRVAAAVFSQAQGVVRAVQSQLTPWAVVRVDTITPAVEPSFESQREQLRQEIATDEAGDLLNTAMSRFEDARAAGAPVADAARQSGLPVVTIPAVEAQGRGQDGQPIAALTGQQDLLRIAFETPESEASDFTPAGDADVVVAVDRIIPATVRPLAQVHDQLAHAWVQREQIRRMRELGAQFQAAVSGGQSFADAARAKHFIVRVNAQPIDRANAQRLPSRGLPTQIFNAAEGAVVTDLRADGGAVLVAQVNHINRVDPATHPQIVEQARAQIEQGLSGSVAEAAQEEIVARAHATRNQQLLDRTYPREDDNNAQSP